MVGRGLDAAWETVTEEVLLSEWERVVDRGTWVKRLGDRAPSGHFWPSNVFVAGLPAVLFSVLAGRPVLIKAPCNEGAFAALLARSFAMHAPELGPTVGAATWDRGDQQATSSLLAAVDRVFAFGDQGSIDALSLLVRPETPLHRFGPRISVGFVADDHRDHLDPTSLLDMAEDVVAWDGAGCLTPRWIFVEGGLAEAEDFARACVPAMKAATDRWPARPLDAERGATRMSFLGLARFAGLAWDGPGWAVAVVQDPLSLPEPPPRTLVLSPISHRSSLPRLLTPFSGMLQGALVLGSGGARREIFDVLRPLGLSLCAVPGQLQRPPLAWQHDEVDLLAALV